MVCKTLLYNTITFLPKYSNDKISTIKFILTIAQLYSIITRSKVQEWLNSLVYSQLNASALQHKRLPRIIDRPAKTCLEDGIV